MRLLVQRTCAALLLFVAMAGTGIAASRQHVSDPTESLQVALRVGEAPSRDFALVLRPGQHGELELAGGDGSSTALRLGVTILQLEAIGASPFRRSIEVQLSVHEQIAGAWVLRGEELLSLKEGRESRVVLDSALGALPVTVTVNGGATTSMVDSRGGLLGGVRVAGLRAACCTSPCQDGSGQTLRCCASGFTCAGCGTQCSGEDP